MCVCYYTPDKEVKRGILDSKCYKLHRWHNGKRARLKHGRT